MPKDKELDRLVNRLLGVFFDLLYHQFAWSYDLVAAVVSAGMWQSWVLAVLPYLPGPRVLEIGHGPGHLQAGLFAAGLQPVGLDASLQMSRLARRLLRKGGWEPALINAYAQSIPLPSACFNQVVLTFPAPFVFHPQTLAEIHRLLAPGGQLVLLPVAWITGSRLQHRLAASLFRLTGQAPEFDPQAIARQAAARVEPAGFTVRVDTLTLPDCVLIVVIGEKK